MALNNRESQMVLGMIARGDKHHDVAAYFGENQARVAEVEQGKNGALQPLAKNELPPKGAPGPKGRRLKGAVNNALKAIDEGNSDKVQNILETALAAYNRDEA